MKLVKLNSIESMLVLLFIVTFILTWMMEQSVGTKVMISVSLLLFVFVFARQLWYKVDAERKLEDSMEQLQRIFSENADAIVMLDDRGIIIEANRTFVQLFGWTESELIGRQYIDFQVSPMIQKEITHVIDELRANRVVREHETIRMTKTGEEKHVVFTATLIENAFQGRRVIVSIMRDITDKKHAEQQLLEANEKVSQLLAYIGDGVIIVDEQWRVTFANPKAMQWFDVGKQQVLMDVLPGFKLVNNIEQDEIWQVEWHDERTNDTYHLDLYPFEQAVSIFIKNVTEEKKALVQLRESEERYRTLFESSPDAILVHADGEFIFSNEATKRIFHLQDDTEVVGANILHFVPPEYQQLVISRIKASHESNEPSLPAEEILIRRNGERFFAEVITIPTTYNGVRANQVIVRDISQRKQMELHLLENEERLRLITNSMHDMLVQVDDKFVMRFISPSFMRTLGYRSEDVKGKELLTFIHEEDLQFLHDEIARAITARNNTQFEARIRHADGYYIWIETIATPIFDHEGQFAGGIVVSRNIMERKQGEEAIKRQDVLLQGVSEAMKLLLTTSNQEKSIIHALSIVGQTLSIDRIAIYEVSDEPLRQVSHRFEWAKSRLIATVNEDVKQNIPLEYSHFASLIHELEQGRIIPLATKDAPPLFKGYLEEQQTVSVLAVPILLEGAFWGFILFEDGSYERRWTANEKSILLVTAASIGGAIEKYYTEDKLRQSTSRLSALIESLHAGILVEDERRKVQVMNKEFLTMFGVAEDYWQERDGALLMAKHLQYVKEPMEYMTMIESLMIHRQVATNIEIELSDGRTLELDYIPIFIKEMYRGHLWHYRDVSERKQNELQLQETNEILRHMSSLDGLTGIANRRYFDELMAKQHTQYGETGSIWSLILFDLDYFKRYNDTYGHQAGDTCLVSIAQLVERLAGPDYVVARYGGEEFTVVMPHATEQVAEQFAERIRQHVEQLEIEHSTSPVATHVTVSLGVTTVKQGHDITVEELIQQADIALYASKNNGKNCVTIYHDHLQMPH